MSSQQAPRQGSKNGHHNAPNKAMRKLLKAMEKQGASWKITPGGHIQVKCPGGGLVTLGASSNGGRRGMDNMKSDLRRAGLEVQ